MAEATLQRRPHWLKVRLSGGSEFYKVRALVKDNRLHTVCESAHCPNLGECWRRKTATFMIMGDQCSRNCRFCAVEHGVLVPLDPYEPQRVAKAVKELGLKYAVITSVTRDDLNDGGAAHFAATMRAIREMNPRCQIEVLIPDFNGRLKDLDTVIAAKPDVLNHNIETVKSLYNIVRPQADYERSLGVLQYAKKKECTTKSGIMLGLGETESNVIDAMKDLHAAGCDLLTIGQYLQPSRHHLPVQRFVTPEEFEQFRQKGLEIGFDAVQSGPLVRSSYHADEQYADKTKHQKHK